MLTAQAWAATTFTVGNLKYTVTDETNLYVSVGKGSTQPTGELEIPSTVTNGSITYTVTSIGGSAFYNCIGLTSVTISNSVTSIGDNAFGSCYGLTSVTIPNTVRRIIGNSVFQYCSDLTTVTISNSVTSIGSRAFYNCSSLTSISYDGTSAPAIGTDAFKNVNSSVKVCVPENYSSDKFGVIKGHNKVTDQAVLPTCTETGLTEGVHCSNCGRVFVAQEEIPATGHNYGAPTYAWSDDNTTCTATKVCANNSEHVVTETSNATSAVTAAAACEAVGTRTFTAEFTGEGFATQQTTEDIPATGHTAAEAEAENYAAPTCTAAGAVDSVVYCSVCQNELLRETKEIPAKGHIEVVDAAVAATCTAAGKTEGKHCSVCNAVLVAQEEIPALGHEFKTYTFDNNATTAAAGTETATCERGCGATDTRTAAGTKIATTPEKGTAVSDAAANAISIYTQNNVIVVENAQEEISVYDAMGRLVCRDVARNVSTDAELGVRTEIRIATPGIYIVKVGGTAKRVMVND